MTRPGRARRRLRSRLWARARFLEAPRPAEEKVLGLERLLRLRRSWKDLDLEVVFTNGVFDILHAGHVELLEGARRLGDRLVVGINTDASARRLGKGPGRPINRLADRAALVASLACVDAVIPFGQDTPERLLSRLRPDILVKGSDYRRGRVAGAGHAGRVVLWPVKAGYSTTSIEARIRAA